MDGVGLSFKSGELKILELETLKMQMTYQKLSSKPTASESYLPNL
jgi:hypothetical protein